MNNNSIVVCGDFQVIKMFSADVVEDETLDSLIDDNEKIKQLLQEVKDWEQDKKTSTEYEKFCTKVFR